MVLQSPYVLGTKIQKIPLEASKLMRFYESSGREVTVSNTKYNPVIKLFSNQWKGLTDHKSDAQLSVPKITAELSVMYWTEVFDNFLGDSAGIKLCLGPTAWPSPLGHTY
eukprot:6602994-Ditylum_brightwellii.AAC.1